MNNSYNILTDIMNIAFYRCKKNLSGSFFFPVLRFPFRYKGASFETAFFITLALFTTWGRNIFPDPKRSPTSFIPPISGPSIRFIERSNMRTCLFNILFNEFIQPSYE